MKKQTKKNEKIVEEKPKKKEVIASKKKKEHDDTPFIRTVDPTNYQAKESVGNNVIVIGDLHEELKVEPEIKEEEVTEIKNEIVPEENIISDTPPIQEVIKHRGRHWKR